MTRTSIFRLCLVVTLIAAPVFSSFAQRTAPEATVSELQGRVELIEPGGRWRPAQVGMELPLGTTISTGFGATAVVEIGPALLQVRQLTRMELEALAEREGLLSTDLYLQVGRVRAEVRPSAGRQNEFRMRSPVATAAVRGTSFEFDGLNLTVETGTVQLTNERNQSVFVAAGESSSAEGDGGPVSVVEAYEAAATVQVYTAPPGETRTEGTQSSAVVSETASIRIDFVIDGFESF
jgi:hypothetical protein